MKWSKRDWRFWRVGQKYDCLLEKYVDLQVECAHIKEFNDGLLARTQAQHRALCSMEKQKATLMLKIKALEESHDHAHRCNQESKIKELRETNDRLLDLIADLKEENVLRALEVQ
jgi:hypothetical protein